MWSYFKNPNLWFTLASVIIAILALIQTNRHIKVNNRQQLFARRLDKYIVIKDLLNLYNSTRPHFCDDIILSMGFQFDLLTNVSYLSDMRFVMSESPNNEAQNAFLGKCELLEKYAVEVSILWNDVSGINFSNFIRTYKDLLYKLYQQKVSVNSYKQYNKQVNENTELIYDSPTMKQKLLNNAKRTKLFETIDKLNDIYDKIKNERFEERLIETLKLKD